MPLPVFVRRLLLIAWDVASWLLAFLMFAWLRYKDSLESPVPSGVWIQ